MRPVINKTLVMTLPGLFAILYGAFPQNASLGIFKDHVDVGNIKLHGSA